MVRRRVWIMIVVAVVAGGGAVISLNHHRYESHSAPVDVGSPMARQAARLERIRLQVAAVRTKEASPALASRAAYVCDGRHYCSQMRSCAEANWMLRHCPGMKMDGDGDGVPCEDQWC